MPSAKPRAVNSNGFSSSASHLMCIEGVFGGSDGKESAYNTGDLSLIPGLGRSPEKGTAAHSGILAWTIP